MEILIQNLRYILIWYFVPIWFNEIINIVLCLVNISFNLHCTTIYGIEYQASFRMLSSFNFSVYNITYVKYIIFFIVPNKIIFWHFCFKYMQVLMKKKLRYILITNKLVWDCIVINKYKSITKLLDTLILFYARVVVCTSIFWIELLIQPTQFYKYFIDSLLLLRNIKKS